LIPLKILHVQASKPERVLLALFITLSLLGLFAGAPCLQAGMGRKKKGLGSMAHPQKHYSMSLKLREYYILICTYVK